MIAAGATLSGDLLLEALWDERAPASAIKVLQLYVGTRR
jgi:hypothetical protein